MAKVVLFCFICKIQPSCFDKKRREFQRNIFSSFNKNNLPYIESSFYDVKYIIYDAEYRIYNLIRTFYDANLTFGNIFCIFA